MMCINCNETMSGDGYTSVLYCPNMSEEGLLADDGPEYAAGDEGPYYCKCDVVNFRTKSNTVIECFKAEDNRKLGSIHFEQGDWHFYGCCNTAHQDHINNYIKNVLVNK